MAYYSSHQIALNAGLGTIETLHSAVSRYGLPIRSCKKVNGKGLYDEAAMRAALLLGELMRLGVQLPTAAELLGDARFQKNDTVDLFNDSVVLIDLKPTLEDIKRGAL